MVTSATGSIDLELHAFFDGYPDQVESFPVGLADTHPWIDGTGYDSAGGLSEVEYKVLNVSPGQTWFNVVSSSDSLDAADGGGGYAGLEVSLYVQAPFYYRFEADVLSKIAYYNVCFNGVLATASWDVRDAAAKGTFPIIYEVDPPDYAWPKDWGTHVDEGFLPAGLYTLSIDAWAGYYRQWGSLTMGDARLLIQLQGDANLDGFVGITDLQAVLDNFEDHVPAGLTMFGDMNNDGYVGINDLNRVLGNWNADVRPPMLPIPEPGTWLLLCAAAVSLARHRNTAG